jgi:hypothetical protein
MLRHSAITTTPPHILDWTIDIALWLVTPSFACVTTFGSLRAEEAARLNYYHEHLVDMRF